MLVFRHALTRDAIHDVLRSTKRRMLHAAVGRAIESQSDHTPATAEPGYHSHAAELWDEITRELSRFEKAAGFVGPCEMIVGVGVKVD